MGRIKISCVFRKSDLAPLNDSGPGPPFRTTQRKNKWEDVQSHGQQCGFLWKFTEASWLLEIKQSGETTSC